MPKFFVISDVHGFYDEMIDSLEQSGFDKHNPDHWLISCGDNWDRGNKPIEVTNFLSSLERKILIKGNHEDLFIQCCERMNPMIHDYQNGTYDTILKLGSDKDDYSFKEVCQIALARTGVFLDQQLDFFETKNYVFVHGWIPSIKISYCDYVYNPEWRYSNQREWDDARWENGIKMAYNGIIDKKTIVCGHWHCSYGHHLQNNTPEFGKNANFNPYYNNGIIAIDACTAATKKVNVLVLEDDFIEN